MYYIVWVRLLVFIWVYPYVYLMCVSTCLSNVVFELTYFFMSFGAPKCLLNVVICTSLIFHSFFPLKIIIFTKMTIFPHIHLQHKFTNQTQKIEPRNVVMDTISIQNWIQTENSISGLNSNREHLWNQIQPINVILGWNRIQNNIYEFNILS